MASIVVTGGAGFVGSALAIGLRRRWPTARITAFDNLKRRGAELNIPRLRAADITFVHGDVRSAQDLDEAGPFDVLIECSAEPSVLAGYGGSPQYLIDTNLVGAVNCLEAVRRHKAAMVFLSTSRVYPHDRLNALPYDATDTRFFWTTPFETPGISERGIGEGFPLDGIRSLYGATKLCAELLIREYIDMYGVRGIVNRCGVIAGPWQMGKVDQGVAVLWAARHLYGGSLSYIGYGGEGRQVRDLLHVEDLVDLVAYQIEHLDSLSGEVFNAGGGLANTLSLKEMTGMCQELTGRSIAISSESATRPADIPLYITDNSHVTHRTGWAPTRDACMIMGDIVAWLREREACLRPILS